MTYIRSIFDIYNKPIEKAAVRVFIRKAYDKGYKIYEIKDALGISSRTVHKEIIRHRGGKKIGMTGWSRRLPPYVRLICVKIKRITKLQNYFLKAMEWVKKLATKTTHIDLDDLIDKILSEKPV
jgi:hypothetical protein